MAKSILNILIKERRRELSMTRLDLARALSDHGFIYTEQAMEAWENARASVPIGLIRNEESLVDALSAVLGIEPVDILRAAGVLSEPEALDPELGDLIVRLKRLNEQQRKIFRQLTDVAMSY